MRVVLKNVESPQIEYISPQILNDETMEIRKEKVIKTFVQEGYDCIIIYADVEHSANFEYLTGFIPRFEEACLVLHKNGDCYLLLGNEVLGMSKHSRIKNTPLHVPQFSLPDQPLEGKKEMVDYFKEAKITNKKVGLIGWKALYKINKDMFDEFGIEYPTADWTWDDVKEASEKFVSGEGADATYGIVNHWVDPNFALICKGGSPYSDDLKTLELNSPEVAEGLDLFGEMVQSKAMPDDAAAKSLPKEQLFVSGHAAMYTLGGFETKLIADEIGDNFEWDVVTMPKVEGSNVNNIMYATGYAMLKTAENKDAAWTFLKEVGYENEDMAKVTATVGIPGNKKVAEGYYKEIKNGPIDNSKYLEGLAGSRLNIWGGAFANAGDQWTQIWQAVTINGQSGQEAIDAYYPALEQAFNEANQTE